MPVEYWHMWKRVVIVGYVMLLFSSAPSLRGEAADEPTLAGYWTLNTTLTDLLSLASAGLYQRSTGEGAGSTVQFAAARIASLLDSGEHLTVAPGDDGTVTVVDGRGVSRVYRTTGVPEWHTFDGALRETRTIWTGRALRQEIRVGAQVRLLRWYRVLPPSGRLIETLVLSAPGSPDRSQLRIYESDRVP